MRPYPLIQPPPRGLLLSPQDRIVAFVDSNGTNLSGYTDFENDNLVKTLADALPRVTDEGDTIAVMAGHAENVVDATMLSGLVAGTRIIGMGSPDQSNAPTFTWTAVGGQWSVTVADVTIANLRLEMNGADDITTALITTGDGLSVLGNYLQVGTGASNDAATAVALNADDCLVQGNLFMSTGGANNDLLTLAAGADNARVIGNQADTESSGAAQGQFQFNQAVLNLYVGYNVLNNRVAAGTANMEFSDVASTGLCEHNILSVLNTGGVASAQGIVISGTTNLNVRFNENYCSDEPGRSGILSPPVVAT